jgi:hypothetical protein
MGLYETERFMIDQRPGKEMMYLRSREHVSENVDDSETSRIPFEPSAAFASTLQARGWWGGTAREWHTATPKSSPLRLERTRLSPPPLQQAAAHSPRPRDHS